MTYDLNNPRSVSVAAHEWARALLREDLELAAAIWYEQFASGSEQFRGFLTTFLESTWDQYDASEQRLLARYYCRGLVTTDNVLKETTGRGLFRGASAEALAKGMNAIADTPTSLQPLIVKAIKQEILAAEQKEKQK